MTDKGKLTMFGKSFNTFGDNEANLCLYTRGDVKIKTPQKFITIFKNGRLNVDDFTEIFKVNSDDEMKKTGVYLVSNTDEDDNVNQSVYLYIDGEKILLASSGDNFLSYSAAQNLTPDQVTLALSNVGIYFQTLDAAKSSGIQNGIVYILEEGEPYKVVNGEFIRLISQTDDSDSSSVDHEHTYTELQIGGIYIDGESNSISGESSLSIQVNGHNYIILKADKIYIKKEVVFDSDINMHTEGAVKGESGFWVYQTNGETYLEVDNLIVHNSSEEIPNIYEAYISSTIKNLITAAEWKEEPTDLQLSLKYTNKFTVGDYVIIQTSGGNKVTVTYKHEKDDDGNNITIFEAELENAPTEDVELQVYYTVWDDEETTHTETVNIAIPATEEDEDDDGNPITSPNTYGSTTIYEYVDVTDITNAVVIRGDSDIYFSSNTDEGRAIPSPYIGTVTSIDPLVVNISTLPQASESILNNLKGSVINKVGYPDLTEYILYHSNYSIDLQKCVVSDNTLTRTTQSKIGDLSNVLKPALDEGDFYIGGQGIYSNHLVASYPKFYGGTFSGIGSDFYPVYHTALTIPTSNLSDEAYDQVVPDIEWVKRLIELISYDHVFVVCHVREAEENETCLAHISEVKNGVFNNYDKFGVMIVDGGRALIVALDESDSIPFSSGYGVGGELRATIGEAIADSDGETNTNNIINASTSSFVTNTSDYAAGFCRNYSAGTYPAGYWFLPSLNDLLLIKKYLKEINYAIDAVGGTPIRFVNDSTQAYWASTEKTDESAWGLLMYESHLVGHDKISTYYVRPVTRANNLLSI